MLKPRLETVLRSVPDSAKVADIGTDHAFLSIALIKTGKAKKVIATDIAKAPLQLAKSNILKSGVNNIETRLCPGLTGIKENEADTIVIAGMGGGEIADILSGALWIKQKGITLVLQAMSSADVLRVWLNTNGFAIKKEVGTTDRKRVYSVITATFKGSLKPLSQTEKYIGKIYKDRSQSATDYMRLQLGRVNTCMTALKDVKERQEEYNGYLQAVQGIEALLKER